MTLAAQWAKVGLLLVEERVRCWAEEEALNQQRGKEKRQEQSGEGRGRVTERILVTQCVWVHARQHVCVYQSRAIWVTTLDFYSQMCSTR